MMTNKIHQVLEEGESACRAVDDGRGFTGLLLPSSPELGETNGEGGCRVQSHRNRL
jgi:hypothetical protein